MNEVKTPLVRVKPFLVNILIRVSWGGVLKQNGKQNTKTKPESRNRMSSYAIKREKRSERSAI